MITTLRDRVAINTPGDYRDASALLMICHFSVLSFPLSLNEGFPVGQGHWTT